MTSSPYAAAVATLRRCQRELAGNCPPETRHQLLELQEEALELLEASLERRRLSTAALVERLVRLERQLADRAPAERAAVIRERLGLSRSRYYELRKLVESG